MHYTSSKAFVQGDEAALLGQSGENQFLSMRFVEEDERWEIKDQVWSDKAFHPDSVYAMIAPAAGAFERAGAPWQNLAPALETAPSVAVANVPARLSVEPAAAAIVPLLLHEPFSVTVAPDET